MLEIFKYPFMQRAFMVGTILAIVLPCIGLPILLKRLSMMGETLSHASLAGVTVGLCFGMNPLLGSLVACIIAALSIEFIRARLKAYQEISTVTILAAAIGIAGVFTSFLGNTNSISSYLFGSIVTISNEEFYLVLGIAVLLLLVFKVIYNVLYLSIFDAGNAQLLGINVSFVNFVFSFLVALTISIAAKTIGSLIVSSLLVIPVICAMQFSKTYKGTLIFSMGISIVCVYIGLFVSYFYNLRPGSVIVLVAVFGLLAAMYLKK